MLNEFPRNIQYAILALLLLVAGVVSPVIAQSSTPTDDDVNRVAKQLYCPVCQNTPLDVCPTEACRDWREEIRNMLAQGKTDQEIKDYFVSYYGARVLNEPPNRLITYLVPAIAILIGALILFRGLQLWIKPAGAGSGTAEEAAPPVQQDEYIARLEEELKKRN